MSRNEIHFRIAEIDVARHSTDEKIVGIFRFENVGAAKNGPVLLIVAEIHSTLYAYERLLDVINATAEQARYLVSGVGTDPVSRFEKLIERINEALGTFAESEATTVAWNRVNIFIVELSEGHLCLAGLGHLMNVFFQKQEDGTYRGFDLFGSLEQPEEINPKKPFASLICGDMKPGDVLFAGSSNLERLRNELRIKERLTTLPPVTAALELRNDLEKRSIPDHFIGAIIACHEMKAPTPVAAPVAPTSTSSIEKLRDTEAEASQHLSPVISPMTGSTPAQIVDRVRDKAKSLWVSVKMTVRERTKSGPKDAMALTSLRGMSAGYGDTMTPKKKLTIIAVVLGIILVGVGLVLWNGSQKRKAEAAAWTAAHDSAADHLNKAESDLIYGNEAKARSEIGLAEQTISSLSRDLPERENKITGLNNQITQLKERLKKVVKLDNVVELASLSAAANEGSLSAPVLTASAAYAADNAEAAILKIDLATKNVKRISLPQNSGSIVGGTEGTTSIIFATSDGKLITVNKSDDTVGSLIWQQSKSSSTTDIVMYAARLYSLDPQANQVWRYQLSGSTFGSETAYIKATNATLAGGTSLAIDSSVYVQKNDGTAIRYLSGGQEGFGYSEIDPPLRAASGIWTNTDQETVFVTDPAEKRLLAFDKNGKLRAQYLSTQFRAPRDLMIDEANKRGIIVDGNRLLFVTLP
ncbi:hypothetical protein KBC59_00560 [Patescibacteria group bacterium]|nr:hypothetical protein [Patescibacteria group bacterium]